MLDTLCIYAFKTGISISGCRMHHNLKCIQGYRRNIQCLHRHSHKRYGYLLSGCQKHIHFSLLSIRINIMCHLYQIICSISHCG